MPSVVRRLARYYDVTDLHIASTLGVSRQTVNSWVNGRTRIPDEIEAGLAAFFGVPREVLHLSPDEALRWVLDHPPAPASLPNEDTVGYRASPGERPSRRAEVSTLHDSAVESAAA